MKPPRVLIIAGSDSGGGAGIQADIKTVTMLGGFAMTAITAITAQNTLGVSAVMPVPADMVVQQMEAVIGDLGVDAVKIGMIGSAQTAHTVADRLAGLAVPIVFDPVMVATSGAPLADAESIAAFERLMAIATVVTPNVPELAALTRLAIATEAELEMAARWLAGRVPGSVLAKGGHLPGDRLVDLLVADGQVQRWEGERIETRDTHGTGCTLASAIATELGKDRSLPEAVSDARRFVRAAMLAAPGFGAGSGPMGHHAISGAVGDMNLNQVTVPSRDYAASVRFYTRLGLTQIVDSPPRYARFECPGGATLSIHGEAEGQAGITLYFEASDLDAWVERLKAQGFEIEAGPRDEPWLWREARLRDPAGNAICLYRAGANRRFPPWRME